MQRLLDTKADAAIKTCLKEKRSFSLIAGAGSGKTTSLITALKYLQEMEETRLRRDDQKIVCITYTNRAVEVISNRLAYSELFLVSTLHKFLWDEIKGFTPNIREALRTKIIPARIEKKKEDDNGGQSKKAISAREKITSLETDLQNLDTVDIFKYNDTNYSDYTQGQINHDDVIDVAAHLIIENEILRRIIGQKYPYIFVDEAQDTFGNVVEALNKVCEKEGLPIVGYFGDPMQQIYDKRAGNFGGPAGSTTIPKEENFRCSREVITLLNSFRKDIQQFPAGKNKELKGSVLIRLLQTETPQGPRNRYTEEQIIRASNRFDEALKTWGWDNNKNMKCLFLARQMIARRLGFTNLHDLFTGQFASSKAQEDYEKGEHFLLKPVLNSLWPLVQTQAREDTREVLNILRRRSPAFDPQGINANQTWSEMKRRANDLVQKLSELWNSNTLGEILKFSQENNLCEISDRLSDHLNRPARKEDYSDELYSDEKSDWLADSFFKMSTSEIAPFAAFTSENTAMSTQHGVKGEEYRDVLVVFDDIDAGWNNYSFTKTLTPNTSGKPTDGQLERSTKLAYVCFSRAEENLRILLFTANPTAAKNELVANKLFNEQQIDVA